MPRATRPAPADRAPLTISYRATESLIPYARNARTHSDAQVAQIAASIREFGFTNPILLGDDGIILAGHGRLAAARKIGLATVPTITLAGLDEHQRRALVLADNKLALNAGWDTAMLGVELADLHANAFPLDVIGFDAPELANLMGLTPLATPDADAATDSTRHLLMIDFDDETALAEAFEEVTARGWKAKVMS